MIPQVDFDIADSILRVLKAWELGNDGLYTKYWSYIKKNFKTKKKIDSGNPKIDFRGTLGNRSRVGRVEVASLARGARECARRAGSHCLRKLST